MAINLKFDLMGNPEPPSIVLANRNGNKLGQLNVNVDSIDVSDKFNAASEFSFTLNKYIDDKPTPLWNKVVDFKLVYCPEWDLWFEIKVETDETTETVKTVFCTQLGQAELSQIKVYNIHINEEGDPNWDTNNETYKSTILYDKEHTDASLLHRLLKDKAPHYSIAYVDESIQRIQKTFSFDDTSICDAFNEIAEEIGCLFVYNSNSTKGGKPSRTISVYDLQQKCNDCGHRGEFTDKCPECGSTDIKYGYGEDTLIFVTASELATEGIQLVTDTDSVKNCFKLEGGDDLMTATIRNCNPNGSDYIWYFSDTLKEDMSKELVEKLESYDKKYQYYYNEHPSRLNLDAVNQYNKLVEDFDADGNLIGGYSRFYDTKSTCLNCGKEDYFAKQCPNCGSENILSGQKLQTISTEITGYPALMTAYYNTIDLLLYLKSGLMPNVEIGEKSLCLDCNHEGIFGKVCPKCNSTNILSGAKYQLYLLNTSFPSIVAVNVDDVGDVSLPTANSAVLSMAKVIVKSTYKVEVIDDSSYIDDGLKDEDGNVIDRLWTGKFKITNYSDEEDYATSEEIAKIVTNDTETFIKQKINKALNKENTDDYSVTGLFAKKLNVDANGNHILEEGTGICRGAETLDENGEPLCPFCAEIKKYALNPLDNFSKACDTVLSILTEQGVGDDGSNEDNEIDKATKKALYDALHKPYFEKQQAINKEIAIRKNEIAIIEGIWDRSDENNPRCTTDGLQQYIEDCQKDIQDALNFEGYLGEDLWLEFCAYRREDKYSNSNYISDGLDNAELFKKANEFIEVAEEEIFKSAELQHSISATLNNLLSLPKFKPLLKSFKTGNWIRVQIDDKVYKLRLLEYGFNYGDSKSISVEFSDVTKIKNGTTDVQDVFEQASSMASSYDSVQRQAKKGNVARSTIDQWIVDGLNSADVQITSNDSEEILLTKSGLLARSYDDITGTYSPEQFKLTHNIMAYTDDNWETVSSALGKHKYRKWNGSSLLDDEGYGLSAKFAQAAYIIGSQFIGGEIVSSNYKLRESGTYINLLNGEFDFAGGKIVYDIDDDDPKKSTLTLKGVTIQWDDVNPPTVEDITDLGDEIDKINKANNALFSTTISEKSVVSPLITGGYLHIKKNASNTGVVIDPNSHVDNDYIFKVYNNGTTTVGVKANGDAEFSGKITANEGNIGGWSIDGDFLKSNGTSGSYCGLYCGNYQTDKYYTTNKPSLVNPGTYSNGRFYAGTTESEGISQSKFAVLEDGSLYAEYASIKGAIEASSGSFTNGTFNNCIINENCTIKGILDGADGTFSGTIEGGIIKGSSIEGGHLYIGDEDGYHAWISNDGVLNADGANISGEINSAKGNIGGWEIDKFGIQNGSNIVSGMSCQTYENGFNVNENSNTNNWFTWSNYSLVTPFDDNGNQYCSPIRFYAGATKSSSGSISMYNAPFRILEDGSLYAEAANIKGTITATSGSFSGIINATEGDIGGFEIANNGLISDSVSLTTSSAFFKTGNFSLNNDVIIFNDDIDEVSYIATSGSRAFEIKNMGGAGIRFEPTSVNQQAKLNITFTQEVSNGSSGSGNKITYYHNVSILFQIDGSGVLAAPYSTRIYWQTNNGATSNHKGYIDITIPAYQNSGSFFVKRVETLFVNNNSGISFTDDNYNTSISTSVTDVNTSNNILYSMGSFCPQKSADGSSGCFLGDGNHLWSNVFAYSPTISTSDRNQKHDIKYLSKEFEDFYNELKPVSYIYNNSNSNRTHIGFIAQDIEDSLVKYNIDTKDFAGICIDKDENTGNKKYFLRYEEFIPLNTLEIQKLKKRVEELEIKLEALNK